MEKNQLPLVSIITPSFNAMPYIVDTIKSVQSQDYPLIEHIVMDGGSTDGTVEYLKGQKNILWISEPDSGQSHALNKGFKLAKGDIIGWLNADDLYYPNAVSLAVNFFQQHVDIDLVYSDVEVINEIGNLLGISKSKSFDLDDLIKSNFIKQPTVFMRRKIIEKLCGVDEDLHYVMDHEFWIRIALSGFKMEYFPNVIIAKFRKCPGTKSFDFGSNFQCEHLKILERIKNSDKFSQVNHLNFSELLRKLKSRYYFSEFINFYLNKKYFKSFRLLTKSIKESPSILIKKDFWLQIFMAFIGKKIDWKRKFNRV